MGETKKKEKKVEDDSAIAKYIKVNPIGPEAWQVDIHIPFLEMSTEVVHKILRIAKQKISQKHRFPSGLLSYEDLMEKDIKTDGINISAKIIKGSAEKGRSQIRSAPAVAPDGKEFEDMLLYLDLFPLKEDSSPMTTEEVWQLLADEGINDEEKIDVEAVQNAIAMLEKDMVPIKNVLLMQGRFPDHGEDAEVEFKVRMNQDAKSNYIGAASVKPNDLILQRIPPKPSSGVGFTVKGETLEPIPTLDIKIIPGEGTDINSDRSELRATRQGIPKALEQPSKDKNIRIALSVSIEPIEVLDGTKKLDVTTDKHVEIKGGLKAGSKVITQGEVIIDGNIDKDVSIVASGNINIKGKIEGGSLTSEGDITSEGEVNSTTMTAHGTLRITGTAYNCELKGGDVIVERVVGGKISAGNKAIIDTVSADEKGFTAKICVGLVAHLKDKVNENLKFITFANKNLDKFRNILSEQIIAEATSANISRMLIIHTKDLKHEGVHRIPQEQMFALKKLIGTIGIIRDLMLEKEKANILFKEQLSKNPQLDSQVQINSAVDNPVDLELSDEAARVTSEDGPVLVKNVGGKVIKENLHIEN